MNKALSNANLQQHYQMLFAQHGRSHESVQYSTKASQVRRFDELLGISSHIDSLIDLGCGLGDLLPVFRQKHHTSRYVGLDFVDAFIHDASNFYHEDQNAEFAQFDILNDEMTHRADYGVIGGIFNNKMSDNATFVTTALHKLWGAVDKGMAFNALSTYVDYQDDALYYQDPLALFDYCKRHFSPYVTLKHDYDVKPNSIPFEYTIYVHRR